MLHITEFAKLFNGQIPIPVEPDLGSQCLAVGDASVQSQPWVAGTSIVRLHAEEACAVKFAANPVATVNDVYMPQGATEYFAVTPGGKMAVIGLGNQARSSADNLTGLLRLVADPKATEARLNDLVAKTQALVKAEADAKAALADAMHARAVLATQQHDLDTKTAALEAAREQAAKDHVIAEKAAADLETRIKAHAAIVATHQKDWDTGMTSFLSRRADFDKELRVGRAELVAANKALDTRIKEIDAREAALKAAEDDYEQRMAQLETIGRRKKAS